MNRMTTPQMRSARDDAHSHAFRSLAFAIVLATLPLLTGDTSAAETKLRGEVWNFTTASCPGCRRVAPTVAKLMREGLPIRKIDCHQNRQLTQQLGIQTIPAFVLVVDGRVVQKIEQVLPEASIRQMIARIPVSRPAAAPEVQWVKNDNRSVPVTGSQATGSGSALGNASVFPSEGIAAADPNDRSADMALTSTEASNAEVLAQGLPNTTAENNGLAQVMTSSEPFASSVRIRVKDPSGMSLGSGTVVFSQLRYAVILSCAHIIRDAPADAQILVDVFDGSEVRTYQGTMLKHNMEADVGLLSIEPDRELPTAMIAGVGTVMEKADPVTSVGCSAGKDPTSQKLQITGINRYKGPDTIECSGLPVRGRSGGGLFNANKQVIGVCIAADTRDQRGLYAGLKEVHKLLDAAELTYLYRATPRPNLNTTPDTMIVENGDDFPTVTPSAANLSTADNIADAVAMTPEEFEQYASSTGLTNSGSTAMVDPAAVAESEVVCIIRPLNDPQAASRVVIINRASKTFVAYLNDEINAQPTPTSARVRTASAPAPQPPRSPAATPPNTMRRPRPTRPRAGSAPQPYRRRR